MQKIFKDGTKKNIYQKTFSFRIVRDFKVLRWTVEVQGECYFIVLVRDPKNRIRVQYHYQEQYNQIILEQNSDNCQPGVIPGPIVKGIWTLEVILINYGKLVRDISFNICLETFVRSNKKISSQMLKKVDVWADHNCEIPIGLNRYTWNKKYKLGQSWYAGDLHVHTVCSDGMLAPFEQDRIATQNNLDFYFVTEHNFLPVNWERSKILSIPGAEITFKNGHFNVLGLKKWVDFIEEYVKDKIEDKTIVEIKRNSEIISLNHPFFNQWSWKYKNIDIDIFDTMEIICNPRHPDSNRATERALKAWKILWNDGHRIWAVGGSDTHLKPGVKKHDIEPTLIGDPTTFVLAGDLTAEEIIEGIKKGRIYISRKPVIKPEIIVNNRKIIPGTDLGTIFTEDQKKEVNYNLIVDNINSPVYLYLIENGEIIEDKVIKTRGKFILSTKWQGSKHKWVTVEIRDKNKRLLAMINPVYIGEGENKIKTWSQLLSVMGDSDEN